MTGDDEKARIKAKYLALRETYRSLVGTLYPSVAYETLMNLRERYVAGTDSFWGDSFWGDLPTLAQPRNDGHAPW